MHPILFHLGPITIYTYGVMLALAVVVCTWLFSLDAQKAGITRENAYDLVFWVVIGGLIGARILYIFVDWPYFFTHPWQMLMIQRGGLAWQGSFVGGILAGILFIRRQKLPLRQILDLAAPYVALGQSIGRIGCFFNGCCYGKPASWGVYFPMYGMRLQPTQLYEMAMLFAIYLILKKTQTKPHQAGTIFAWYMLLAAVERFLVEFVRADHTWTGFGLSWAQYMAIGVFIAGLALMKAFKK